jgi:hypothetical protein
MSNWIGPGHRVLTEILQEMRYREEHGLDAVTHSEVMWHWASGAPLASFRKKDGEKVPVGVDKPQPNVV